MLMFIFLFSSIFLIDHAWMYERQYAKTHLDTIPGLAERMAALMGVQGMIDKCWYNMYN